MKRIIAILIVGSLAVAGCRTPGRTSSNVNRSDQVQTLLNNKQYHQAFRQFASMHTLDELQTADLSAASSQSTAWIYFNLLTDIATQGAADWNAILSDDQLPLEMKVHLVHRIHDEMCDGDGLSGLDDGPTNASTATNQPALRTD